MPTFQVNDGTGFELNYEVIPGVLPETTLFIHGNLASNRWWYPAQEIWAKKAKGQNLQGSMILAEFRGCGKSSKPRGQQDIDMHLFARDFNALVENLNLGPIHVVGHSTGGLIAALMLAKAPHLYNKAVFLDPVGATGVTFQDTMTAAFEQMKANKELVAMVMSSTIHQNDPTTDFFRQIVIEDAFHAVNTVGAGVLKALDGLDVREECSKIMHSVLVLHGEHDQLLPIEDSKAMAGLIKNAKFQIIEGHGHCTNAENPAKFTELVESFAFSH
jgi:pimeloyl-ACP methyl ester carboxylesterase